MNGQESGQREEKKALILARDQMAADLKLERERSDGLLKSLNRLQSMVNELEALRGPNKLDGIRKEAAKVLSLWYRVPQLY